jgi:prepilin-type N-terminal cleavage/methylation domain-containing protein
MNARGFTFFEVIVALSVIAIGYTTLGSVFRTNTNMVEESRALQRAEGAHRKNMAALSRVLRGIDIQTLTGVNSEGVAASPGFSRVTGADLEDLTYTGSEQLLWLPAPVSVAGVPSPGAIYLLRDGERYLVADRVPKGAFYVRQEGLSLVIHLSTYWSTSARRLATRTSESVISVRN